MKSLQWRLVFIFVMLVFILIAPVSLFLNKKIGSWYYDGFRKGIETGFENWTVKRDTDVGQAVKYLRDDRNAITQFQINEYKSYTIIPRNTPSDIVFSSDVIYDAGKGRAKLSGEIVASENLLKVMSGEEKGAGGRLVRVDGRDYFDYARLVTLAGGDYILYFRYSSDAWEDDIADFNLYILSSLLILIAISLVLGYMFAKTITAPINRVMNKARGLAAGDFDQTLEVKSGDEIGQLARTFNYMASSLKKTMNEISSEKSKIETILNYMTDGIVAFNLKGAVIHVNPAARGILPGEAFTSRFNDFMMGYGVRMDIGGILYNEAFKAREMVIKVCDKFVRMYFAVFTDEARNPGGIITVLQDITEQQKLENMRREFVANVSHELRTPLTSIKSYAESLLDGAIDEKDVSERFLGVINSEADRMTRLVRDLLQLSSLDNRQMKWNMEEASFTDAVRTAVDKMQMEAAQKGHKLEMQAEGDLPDIVFDRDRIEQVVLNLLSNAIKYTPENGEIKVKVGKDSKDGKDGNVVYLKVSDNGMGIPEEDLPRIFERFYRVDKARSSQMGGTGLGLSIAKEIVEAHLGSISISSVSDKGTEVTVSLPIARVSV